MTRDPEEDEDDAREAASSVEDDRLRLIFLVLPPGAPARGAGGADLEAPGRPDHHRGRARLPPARADDRPAAGAGQAQDPRRRHSVPRAARPRAARATRRRAGDAVPHLQRGLRGHERGLPAAARALRRSHPARPADAPADAGRDGGGRTPRPDAAAGLASRGAHRRRRRSRAAGGPGPEPLGSRGDRGGPRSGRGRAARRPGGAVRAAGGHRRRPRGGRDGGGHRLAADRRAVPRALPATADAGRRAQPRGRRRHGLRPGPGPRAGRRPRRERHARRLPPAARHPGRPAAPPGARRSGAGGVPESSGARDQPGRARVPPAAAGRGRPTSPREC